MIFFEFTCLLILIPGFNEGIKKSGGAVRIARGKRRKGITIICAYGANSRACDVGMAYGGACVLWCVRTFSFFMKPLRLPPIPIFLAFGTFAWDELGDETKAQLALHGIIDCTFNFRTRALHRSI